MAAKKASKTKKKMIQKKNTKKVTKKKATAKKATKKTGQKKVTAKKTAKKSAKKVAKKATKTTAKKATTTKPTTATRKISSGKSKSTRPTPNMKTETAAAQPAAPTITLNPGDTAPDFTLADQTGTMVSLSELRGKTVVLYFYPKDDTPGCTKEACSFRDNIQQFGANSVILGVSADDAQSHQSFIQKYGLNFQLLSDVNKDTSKAYGVWVEKNMYGKTYMGIERTTFIINPNGQISEVFRQVKVDGHTEEVLEAVAKIA